MFGTHRCSPTAMGQSQNGLVPYTLDLCFYLRHPFWLKAPINSRGRHALDRPGGYALMLRDTVLARSPHAPHALW